MCEKLLITRLQQRLSELWSRKVHVEFLKFSSNHNFKVTIDRGHLFCRLYRSNKWNGEQIRAELSFLEAARKAGIKVQAPVRNPDNEYCFELESGERGALFEWCPGCHLYPDSWDSDFVFSWGQALGDLHEFCKGYEEGPDKRPTHDDVPWHRDLMNLLEECSFEDEIMAPLRKELEWVNKYYVELPKSRDVYGYVHYDFHPGNILVKGKDFWLIDFDDLCWHFYVWDFAMVRHKLAGRAMARENEELKAKFVEGYRTRTELKSEWEKRLRLFERIRHLFMIGWLARKRMEEKWAWLLPRYAKGHSKYISSHSFDEELG